MFEVFYQSIQKQKKKERYFMKDMNLQLHNYILFNKKTINMFADDKILIHLAYTLIVTFKI